MASNQRDEVKAGVCLENLVTHKDAWKLAKHIFHMLTSLGVIRADIHSIDVDRTQGLAFVHLRTKDVEEFVVRVFSDIHDVMNFFDVRKLAPNPNRLKVTRRKANFHSQKLVSPITNSMDQTIGTTTTAATTASTTAESPVESVCDEVAESPVESVYDEVAESPVESVYDEVADSQEDITPTPECDPVCQENQSEQAPPVESSSSNSTSNSNPEFETLVEESNLPPCVMRSAATSMTAFLEGGVGEEEEDNETSKASMVDVKTSTPQMSPCFCPDTVFYHKNQHVGSESRHVEFKRGGIITDQRSFRSLVGKYLCAFINTEGGTIYFGVTDDGEAVGISINQRNEDQIRLTIDNAVSTIKPHVPTTAYSINFAKIMNADGQIDENLKVLEICVKPCHTPTTMHSFDNNVYVRRDGSLRTA